MKNFTRRRGTGVAAAALSLALVAPLTQPVAGAEDAAASETVVPVSAVAETTTTVTETTAPAASSTTTVTSSTSNPAASSTTTPVLSGSSITDNSKCRNAVLGWGIPLAVLVPVGILASAAVPGLRALNEAAGNALRDANAMFQDQVGIMNPELAGLLADFNDQLRQFNTDISQLAFGAAFLGLGVGALAHLGTACSPAATIIPTKPVDETTPATTTVTTTTTAAATSSSSSETTTSSSSSSITSAAPSEPAAK